MRMVEAEFELTAIACERVEEGRLSSRLKVRRRVRQLSATEYFTALLPTSISLYLPLSTSRRVPE